MDTIGKAKRLIAIIRQTSSALDVDKFFVENTKTQTDMIVTILGLVVDILCPLTRNII